MEDDSQNTMDNWRSHSSTIPTQSPTQLSCGALKFGSSSQPGGLAPSLRVDSPSLTPDSDSESVYSVSCSQKTCSDCCEEDRCPAECVESCHGFVDCDDADPCTKSDCHDVTCRDSSPPCFNAACVPALTEDELAAAANLASTVIPMHSSWDMPAGQSFLDFLGPVNGTGESCVSDGTFGTFNPGHTTQDPLSSMQFPAPTAVKEEYTNVQHDAFCYPVAKKRRASSPHDFHTPSLCTEEAVQEQTAQLDLNDSGSMMHCHWGSDCLEGFGDWSAMNNHIYRAHVKPMNEVHCQWNNCEEATDPDTILTHVKRKHALDVDEHICLWAGCSSRFLDHADLERHVISAHVPSNALFCQWNRCGALAEDPFDLSTHLQTDHSVDPTLVAFNETKAPNDTFDNGCTCHWIDASEDNQSKSCGMPFSSSDGLQQHVKTAHVSTLRKKTGGYVCRWQGCGRMGTHPFSQRGKLERHMQVHTGFKSCRCELCGKEFSAPQALQQHQRTHTGEKPFVCEVCGKDFAQGSALTMHRRTHTKERPLRCDFPGCHKTFSESSNLSKHKKTHNAVGQHRCPHPSCDKSFHRLDQLKRHYKTHERRSRDASVALDGAVSLIQA